MKNGEFKCACCGGEFEKGWSDEEALAEAKTQFTQVELSDKAVVCDDCYKNLMRTVTN